MSDGEAAPVLRLTGVTRRFGEVTAVDDLSLAVLPGEFVTLLGPSGCGKTTALRLIAGFEAPDAGTVHFRGEDITGWPPQRRGFGMVFQNYALFPHLNVFENVAFGLRARRVDAGELRRRVLATLDVVDLAALTERPVQALSGGQQQRVAVARALAIEPPLLLLDEPLSNLDQALRVQTRNDLRRLVKELGITALFVTHDQEEAFDLSDRIAVMRAGRLRQLGSPQALYREPADRFVAGFVGRANVLEVERVDAGAKVIDGVVWPVSGNRAGTAGGWILVVRPEDLDLLGDHDAADEAGGVPSLRGRIRDRRFRGESYLYRIEVEGARAASGGTGRVGLGDGEVLEVVSTTEGLAMGAPVRIRPKRGARLHLFPERSA
jgi:ABC-type Fe3+/spermidine/putrescine transport system ATPase subunit